MKCETCRWHGDGKPHGIPNDGACHFQPPFPRVRPEDWCSHWHWVDKGWTLMSDLVMRNEEQIMGKIKNLNYWNVMWLHNKIGQEIWL